MDFGYMIKILPGFISVLPLTLVVILCSGLFGFLLSVLVTGIRIKRVKIFSPLMELYISFTRSTPILLQMLLVYYGLPVVLSLIGININNWSGTLFAIATLVLHNGAFLSEILRPAYLAVDEGQKEAADSLGFTSFQKLTRIVFPQVLPVALPGLGNALIYLIQDTSILFIIGVVDIMGTANNLISNDFGSRQIDVFLTVALIYWAISYMADKFIKYFERKTARYHLENGLTR
ncbi:amino acid ABC transporter permease [Sporolactobacillus putidus]|nr:amino acid ABC transporter permease [Sporolactobacillus putidus]